jgi:hypothetical protein
MKPYAEYTIADVIRLKPSWLQEKQTDGGDKLTKEIIPHLAFLISAISHIAAYRFEELFGGFDITSLTVNDINQKVMTFSPKPRSLPVPQVDLAPRSLSRFDLVTLGQIRPHLEVNRQALVRSIENVTSTLAVHEAQIKAKEEKMVQLRREVADCMAKIHRARLEKDALERAVLTNGQKLDPKRIAIIKSIPNHWILVEVTAESFTIARRTPIIITHASIAKTLNLGFCAIQYDWDMGMWKARNLGDYIDNGHGGFQPHLSGEAICWGNMRARADRLVSEGNYTEYWALLESILTTYCGDNPYVRFDDLERKYTSHWKCANTSDSHTSFPWFTGSLKATLMREWAKNGSAQYLDQYEKHLPTSASFEVTPEKRERMKHFCNGFIEKFIMPRYETFIQESAEQTGIYFASEFVELCKKHKIPILERDLLAKYNFALGDVDSSFVSLMLCWHGSIPETKTPHGNLMSSRKSGDVIGVALKNAKCYFFYCNEDRWSHNQHMTRVQQRSRTDMLNWTSSSISLAADRQPIEEIAARELTTIRNTYSGTALATKLAWWERRARLVPNLGALPSASAQAATASATPADATPADASTVTLESIEDNEHDCDVDGHDFQSNGHCEICDHFDSDYCEHPDGYDDNGYCRICDYYSEDHDTREHEFDDTDLETEEVAAEAAPF